MSYLGHLFIAVDQLGNVLAGGNPDNTISSRVGYYNNHKNLKRKAPWQWRFFEQIIDATFYPVDGPSHCHEAYFSDAGETFDPETNDFLIFLAACIIIPSCLVIALFLYTFFLFKLVSPKLINRNDEVKSRLKTAEAKLNGILHELNQHIVKIDPDMLAKAVTANKSSMLLVEKIKGILDVKKPLTTPENKVG